MSEKSNIVLSVKDVTKDFYLPHEKQNSIKSAVVNLFKPRNKEADTQHALRGISFDIKEGEFFGILGRNGSGKSTTLKMISEIYQPTTGTVTHKGKLVPFIELGVGFNPELTGRENVYLNGALLGFSEKEIDARYDEIVSFAELENFMDQKLKNYSSGMQVRLAFAVATHAEADILVVDEVLAVGDADFQRKCYDFFKSLKKTGKTVVFVTHDMSAVREYCDEAILINDGVISHRGSAQMVANEYMKLFNKAQNNNGQEKNSSRWGTGDAQIHKLTAKVVEDDLVIDFVVDRKKDIDSLVMGIRVQDGAGKVVAAFNTEGVKNLGGKEGRQSYALRTPNIYGRGSFHLNATLREGQVSICDNWDGAAVFTAVRNVTNSEPIVPPISVEVI